MCGTGGTSGIGLVEVYDLDRAAKSKLANISTRGFVDTNDNVMSTRPTTPSFGLTTIGKTVSKPRSCRVAWRSPMPRTGHRRDAAAWELHRHRPRQD